MNVELADEEYDEEAPILDAIATMTDALDDQQHQSRQGSLSRISLIRAARLAGHTLEEIAQAAGITRQRVGQLLERGET